MRYGATISLSTSFTPEGYAPSAIACAAYTTATPPTLGHRKVAKNKSVYLPDVRNLGEHTQKVRAC